MLCVHFECSLQKYNLELKTEQVRAEETISTLGFIFRIIIYKLTLFPSWFSREQVN